MQSNSKKRIEREQEKAENLRKERLIRKAEETEGYKRFIEKYPNSTYGNTAEYRKPNFIIYFSAWKNNKTLESLTITFDFNKEEIIEEKW